MHTIAVCVTLHYILLYKRWYCPHRSCPDPHLPLSLQILCSASAGQFCQIVIVLHGMSVCVGEKYFPSISLFKSFQKKNVSWNIYRCFPCKMLIMNLRMNVQYITKLWKWLLRVCLDACFVLNMCCSCCMRVCICMCVYRVGKQEGEDDLLVWRIRLIRVCRSGLADITTRLQKRREILRQRKNKRDWQRERV